VHRNLSLAYYNKLNDPAKALASLQKTFMLDQSDARVLMELDQLNKRLNTPPTQRLTFLENHLSLVEFRDDLYLERVTLYNQAGKFQKAKDLLAAYKFHPWEGGEGRVVGQYLICQLELAKKAIQESCFEKALQLLNEAEDYPPNLGEGKLFGTRENDIFYLKGLVYEQLGESTTAEMFFNKAANGNSEPVQAVFYNDPQPDKIFYQGLALLKLQKKAAAEALFSRLISFGQTHINDTISIDYFAVSLPDLLVFDADLNFRNRVHCLYMIALGELGLGRRQTAELEECFDAISKLDCNHQGALIHKEMISFLATVVTDSLRAETEKKSP
jgi:tetratricopeptide (TPR) repeat protein